MPTHTPGAPPDFTSFKLAAELVVILGESALVVATAGGGLKCAATTAVSSQ
ncbi:MAG: hypothetical protein JNM56_12965 [Planctomycetia bacterium]|nr:hypothetical protein [Planctomycetia bacterium]